MYCAHHPVTRRGFDTRRWVRAESDDVKRLLAGGAPTFACGAGRGVPIKKARIRKFAAHARVRALEDSDDVARVFRARCGDAEAAKNGGQLGRSSWGSCCAGCCERRQTSSARFLWLREAITSRVSPGPSPPELRLWSPLAACALSDQASLSARLVYHHLSVHEGSRDPM
jgi:hypothetical protein